MDNFDNVLVIDADGHVYEGNIDLRPRMPEKWRSQAPINMKDNEGNSRMLLEGRLWSASQGLGPGVSGPMTDKARGFREGMVDPMARLKDMDQEGIDVAILFGTQIALTVNGLMSKELAAVLCHAVQRVADRILLGRQETAARRRSDSLPRSAGGGERTGISRQSRRGHRHAADQRLRPQ